MAVLVDHAELVAAVAVEHTMAVMEHISVSPRDVRNFKIYGHIAFGINKLYPAIVVNRCQSVGKHPCMFILRFDSQLSREQVEIAATVAIAVAHQRVVAQRLGNPVDVLHRLLSVASLHITIGQILLTVKSDITREILA